MTTIDRDTIISEIIDATPTEYAINALEVLDGTPDKGLMNIRREVEDEHGRAMWVYLASFL